MLWKKCVKNKKDGYNRYGGKQRVVLLLAMMFVLVAAGCGREADIKQETSSIRRIACIDAQEIYLASEENMVLFEHRSVSGNTVATVSGNTIKAKKFSQDAAAVYEKLNQERKAIGLPELVWDDELAEAAEIRAEEIAVVFSHTRPDGSEWWTTNEKAVYGENLAKGYQSAEEVMKAWMASPEHKDNILYPSYKKIGIAVYKADGKWYWAQEFGY